MFGKHAIGGNLTGNPLQPVGRHLDEGDAPGRFLMGLGDRNRVRPDLIAGAEALDSGDNDPNNRYKLSAFDVLSN